jgi:phosphatidylinositol glycan class V
VPNIYAYVQAKYWNVGLFNYYQLHQLPNFLLASPVVFLSAWGIVSFLRRFSLFASPSAAAAKSTGASAASPAPPSAAEEPYLEGALVPFVAYWAVQVVIGMLFMHVQVITRFLSASPALYWFCASFYDDGTTARGGDETSDQQSRTKKRPSRSARRVRAWMQYLIAFYFLAYTLIGALLFCNFYPWT